MTTEDWAEEKAEWKVYREARIAVDVDTMQTICYQNDVTITEFAKNSFRLTKEGCTTFDWYPKSQKVFNHKTKEWRKMTGLHLFIGINFK